MCVGKCRVQAGSRNAIIKLNLKPRIPNLYGRFTAENLVNGILCEFLLEKEMNFSLFVSILYDPEFQWMLKFILFLLRFEAQRSGESNINGCVLNDHWTVRNYHRCFIFSSLIYPIK